MVLGPETDNMVQFLDPETVNKGERSYIFEPVPLRSKYEVIWSQYVHFVTTLPVPLLKKCYVFESKFEPMAR